MQIQITGRHIDLTDALRDYTTEKFERLKKRGDHITNATVTLDVEKVQQIAKATIYAAGMDFHARAESADMYSAIDLLVDKLGHQITKHKEIAKNHHHPADKDLFQDDRTD